MIIKRIIIKFCILSFIIISYSCAIFIDDPILIEYRINNSDNLLIHYEREWECGIPIYFEIIKNKKSIFKNRLRSACFYVASYEIEETKKVDINIRKINNKIIIRKNGNRNIILAMYNLKDNLVYPAIGGGDKIYYNKIEKMLSQLKIDLNNNDIKLR